MTEKKSLDVSKIPYEKELFKPFGNQHKTYIDGLRALAVILVILSHFYENFLPSGFVGVDVFFVISGYVITLGLLSKEYSGFSNFCLYFYSRRIKRLLPALCVVVLFSSFAICLFNPDAHISINTGLTALFGVSNIFLWIQASDYFAGSTQLNPFTHTWSLGVEEQFYLIFPLVLWFLGIRLKDKSFSVLRISLIFLGVASLLGFLYFSNFKPIAAYYLMPARFWELSTGVVLAISAINRTSKTEKRQLTSLTAVVVLLATCFFPSELVTFSIPLATICTAVLIYNESNIDKVYKFFSSPIAVHFGKISYSLYLWHWPILVLGRWTIGLSFWSSVALLLVTLVMAEFCFRYIEQPLRNSNWARLQVVTLAYGIGAAVITAVGLYVILKPSADVLYQGNRPSLAESGAETLAKAYNSSDRLSWAGENCVLQRNRDVGKKIDEDNCSFGKITTDSKRIVVIGNSFSAAFLHGFEGLARNENYVVTVTSSWGASVTPNISNTSEWNEASGYYWKVIYPKLISSLKKGDWVFLVNDMHDFLPKEESRESKYFLNQYRTGLVEMSENLTARGVRLAVLHGNPFVREAKCEPAIAVDQWFSPFGRPCNFYSKEDSLKRRMPLDNILRSLDSKVTVVDLFEIFCPATTCSYNAKNGQVLYRDSWSHPSVEAAILSYPIMRDAFLEN